MKTQIIAIGNSKGVRIPKALLEQLKFEKTVEFEILPEGLLLRPVREKQKRQPREGWEQMFRAALAAGETDDSEEFADWNENSLTSFDEEEW